MRHFYLSMIMIKDLKVYIKNEILKLRYHAYNIDFLLLFLQESLDCHNHATSKEKKKVDGDVNQVRNCETVPA